MVLLVPQASTVLSTTVICGGYHSGHMRSLLPAFFKLKASYKTYDKLVYEMPTLFQKKGTNNFYKLVKIMN